MTQISQAKSTKAHLKSSYELKTPDYKYPVSDYIFKSSTPNHMISSFCCSSRSQVQEIENEKKKLDRRSRNWQIPLRTREQKSTKQSMKIQTRVRNRGPVKRISAERCWRKEAKNPPSPPKKKPWEPTSFRREKRSEKKIC